MAKKIDFKELKQRVRIMQIAEHYGWPLKDKGKDKLIGACPIHDGEQGSTAFQITPSKDLWYCFKCKEGGNILDIVVAVEKCDIRTAGLKISEWFNLDERGETPQEPQKPSVRPSGFMRDLEHELRKLLAEGDEEAVVRFVKGKCLESYRNGQDSQSRSE